MNSADISMTGLKIPYLVQRGKFRETPRKDPIQGIDDLVEWDYMGSSEFEWGALPASLAVLTRQPKDKTKTGLWVKRITMPVSSVGENVMVRKDIESEFAFIFPTDYKEEHVHWFIKQFLYFLGINPPKTKKSVYLRNYFVEIPPRPLRKGEKPHALTWRDRPVDLWWDICNHFMVMPASRVDSILDSLAVLRQQGFSKTWREKQKSRGSLDQVVLGFIE